MVLANPIYVCVCKSLLPSNSYHFVVLIIHEPASHLDHKETYYKYMQVKAAMCGGTKANSKVRTFPQGCTHTHTHTYTRTHTYTHTYAHTHTFAHTHVHTYTHTYTHILTHTYTHTYTHTCATAAFLSVVAFMRPSSKAVTLRTFR